MDAAELGRELDDASAVLLVCAVASFATLTYGFGALAAPIGAIGMAAFLHRRSVSSVPQLEAER